MSWPEAFAIVGVAIAIAFLVYVICRWGVKKFAGIHTKGGNMSDDISLAMEGALVVIVVVGVYCLVVLLMERLGN